MDSDSDSDSFERLGPVFRSKVLDKLLEGKLYRLLVSLKYELEGVVKV
jgi:hypothetical protein